MPDIAILADNLGKRYRLGEMTTVGNARLGEGLFSKLFARRPAATAATKDFWAIRNVSFELRYGEVLGVIGRNGAGKSTLLKILSRVTAPTEGRGEIRGRLGSLLEVGIGFHPDLTGRENVYLNGAVLGLSRKEVARRFDQIVDFAGIEGFIDTPVKRYSSGMYMRLAFSVAAHLDTEVLIVDEVLAVGDAAFQRKCTRLMRDARAEGRAILFVSHSMTAVQGLCTRGLVLDQGTAAFLGSTDEAVQKYFDISTSMEREDDEKALARAGSDESKLPPTLAPFHRRKDRQGDLKIKLTELEVRDAQGRKVRAIRTGETLQLHLFYEVEPGVMVDNLMVGFNIRTDMDLPALHHNNRLTGEDLGKLSGKGRIVFTLPNVPLIPGSYLISYALMPEWGLGGRYHDCINMARELHIEPGDYYGTGQLPMPGHAIVVTPGAWSLAESEAPASPAGASS
ncbi:MAG: ABC transporter ATP-binding protein [Phycisphaerales bacterium]|nr:ABC transporter ATP-binding protein [Phycisphaerales bacterium]